jgi:hypothetical protein
MDYIGNLTKMGTREFMKSQGRQWIKEYQQIGQQIRPYTNGFSTMLNIAEYFLPFIPGVGLAIEAGALGLSAGLAGVEGTFENADEIMREFEKEDREYGERLFKPIYQTNINDLKIIRRPQN